MRVLLTVQMDTEKANKAIVGKTLATTMKSVFDRIKPEAAYFGALDGMRTGYVVFDLKDPSDIPSIAEPFFQDLGAKITFIPVMNFDDVQAGLQKS
ncbi:hypothetical protein P3T36_005240 [Kitasatospora sp. MAP12-15]|uniref:DUF3303 family protein n=1 Tax=unclassified Kitasatospora TaxID=2633591 RepID=UPI002473A183|nr:DUF3303 family protein [Kitasatospora sp. MAP12-44]MDH6113597.1 hypothetical protein [Kitasatospora sp. MAP12-44]